MLRAEPPLAANQCPRDDRDQVIHEQVIHANVGEPAPTSAREIAGVTRKFRAGSLNFISSSVACVVGTLRRQGLRRLLGFLGEPRNATGILAAAARCAANAMRARKLSHWRAGLRSPSGRARPWPRLPTPPSPTKVVRGHTGWSIATGMRAALKSVRCKCPLSSVHYAVQAPAQR